MTEESGLAGSAAAVEAADAVDTGRSVEAGRVDAVVDVVAAVRTVPAVDADAVVAAVGVGTGGTVLADRRLLHALVHIRFAVLAGKARRTLAVIGVDPVHTGGTVLAQITRAVVNILLAIFALETGWTFALIVELGRLLTGASVLARRRRARNVGRFTVLAGISGITHALVGTVRIDALATIQAGILDALLDILGAGRTLESLRTDTLEVAARDGASATVAARRRRAQILLVAVFARVADRAQAAVVVQGLQLAGSTVVARRRIARVFHRNFAQTRGKPDRAPTHERRNAIPGRYLAGATVLAPRTRPVVARISGLTKFTGISRRTVAVGSAVRFVDACAAIFAR